MAFEKGDLVIYHKGEGDQIYVVIGTREQPAKQRYLNSELTDLRPVPDGMDYTIVKYPLPEYPNLNSYIDVRERDIFGTDRERIKGDF